VQESKTDGLDFQIEISWLTAKLSSTHLELKDASLSSLFILT